MAKDLKTAFKHPREPFEEIDAPENPTNHQKTVKNILTTKNTQKKTLSNKKHETKTPKKPKALKRKAPRKWGVHKFGGASLNDAKLYQICGDLLLSESQSQGMLGSLFFLNNLFWFNTEEKTFFFVLFLLVCFRVFKEP